MNRWRAALVVLLIASGVLAIVRQLGRERDPVTSSLVFHALEQLEPNVRSAIETAIRRAREEGDAEAIGELGRVYHANEFPELARRCYEIAVELDPNRHDWSYYLGRLAVDSGRADAVEWFRKCTEQSPGFAPCHYHLGSALLDFGDLEKAERAYERYIELEPDVAWGYLGRARVARRLGRDVESVDFLTHAAARPPRTREVAYLLATTYRRLGRIEEADAALLTVSRLPDLVAPHDDLMNRVASRSTGTFELLRQAEQKKALGAVDEAVSLYEDVLAAEPDNYAALANLGNLYKQLRQYGPAEEQLLRAVTVDPSQSYAHAILAGVYLETNRLPETANAAATAIERDPQAYNAHYYLGRARAQSGRVREALGAFRTAAEIAPDRVEIRYALAVCYEQLGLKREAEVEFDQVLRLAPNHGPARERLQGLRLGNE